MRPKESDMKLRKTCIRFGKKVIIRTAAIPRSFDGCGYGYVTEGVKGPEMVGRSEGISGW